MRYLFNLVLFNLIANIPAIVCFIGSTVMVLHNITNSEYFLFISLLLFQPVSFKTKENKE
jgi:hypothetical protein